MLTADILSIMEVQHPNHNHQQSEKQSSFAIETADLSLDHNSESNRNDYSSLSKLRDEQDENCSHFGLDLDLPHPDNYLPETVDFPSSPSAMMKYRDDDEEEDRIRMSRSNQLHNNGSVTDSEDEQSFCAVIDSNNSVHLKKEIESSDSANVSDNEEYFEDFHLPMTNQNNSIMSTRRSFKRRVKASDINVPDSDRIEGIVKLGELNRHGSIRRKIVPLPQDFTNDSFYSDHSPIRSSPVKRTSTPNKTFADLDAADDSIIISGQQILDGGFESRRNIFGDGNALPAEVTPLDEETVAKIRDCLDADKVKDIYTLGSRLQDLLTTAEIEEIIGNSHRYGDFIGQSILLALNGFRQSSSGADTTNKLQSDVNVGASYQLVDTENASPPDLLDNNGLERIPQKAMKRISIVDDMMTRACDDDSDTEYDLSAVGQRSSADGHAEEVEVDQVSVIKEESNQQPQNSSVQVETPKSESLPTPSDGWDITPDRTSAENSITERMPKPDLIPKTSKQQEDDKEHNWRSVMISGLERKIDLKVIEPYKKVLSHGGYQGDDCQTAIIVFSACFLPDRSRVDYDYVMDHLFLYVLTTLDQLVAEDYVLVYFHGATPKSCIPRFSWVKNCYQMIDRRLRKNLKRLYLVHPTLWLKAAVLMCRPFISAKFSRKIVYVPNLPSLTAQVPIDQACIPDRVKQLEFTLMIQDIKRRKGMR